MNTIVIFPVERWALYLGETLKKKNIEIPRDKYHRSTCPIVGNSTRDDVPQRLSEQQCDGRVAPKRRESRVASPQLQHRSATLIGAINLH